MSLKIDGKQLTGTFLEGVLAENGLKSYFQALYNVTGGLRVEFTVMGALKLKPFDTFQFTSLDSTPKAYQNKQFRITSIAYDFVNNTAKVVGYQVSSNSVGTDNRPTDPPLKRRNTAIQNEILAADEEDFTFIIDELGELDSRFLQVDNNLSDLDSASDARDNLDVYSTGEVDEFVEDIQTDLVSLRLADESLMDRKAEAGLEIEAGDGLDGGGLLTDDLRFDVDPVAPIKITTGKVDLGFVAPLVLTGNDLDVQDAGVSQRGVVSIGAQVFKGEKTLEDTGKYKVDFESNNFDDTEDTYTGVQLSQSGIKAETIRANELRVKAFIAEISAALYGEDILTKSRGVLSRDFTVPAVSGTADLFVEDLEGLPNTAVFENNDFVRLRVVDRSGGGLVVADVWGNVTGYTNLSGGEQSWTFTRIAGGAADTSDVIFAGSIAIDYGQSGDGVIIRSVIGDNTPRDSILTWVTSPVDPANFTLVTRTGNLGGIDDASGFGFYGENTFLTGELLVGDLTETDNFLKFDGSLTINADSITLDAIGDVGTATLDLQSDLINLFLQEESTYAGVQFLAGQVIISASEVDGQGRAKLATVRLDATGDESVVGISADAFLLETNRLFIDSEASNNGLIALGNNASAITVANNNAGIALNGNGDVKFYGNADNFLRKVGTSLEIKSTNAIIQGGDLLIQGTSAPKIQLADSFRKVTIDGGTSFPTIQTRGSGSDNSSPFAVGGSWDSDILLTNLFKGDTIRIFLDLEYASSGGDETQEFEVTVFENDGGGNNAIYQWRDTITGSTSVTGEKNYDIEFPSPIDGSYIGSEGIFIRVNSLGSGTGNFEVTNTELIHYNSETYINKGGFKVQKSPNSFISNNEIKGAFALNVPIIEDTSTAEAIFFALNQHQGKLVMVRNQVEDPDDSESGIFYYQIYQVGQYGAL